MKENRDFDKTAYKKTADKIKLSANQKQILLDEMRKADAMLDLPENYNTAAKKKRPTYTIWIKAVAASLVVALLCSVMIFGFGTEKDKYSFSIIAMAAEVNSATDDEGKMTEITADDSVDIAHSLEVHPVFKGESDIPELNKSKYGYEELSIAVKPKMIYPQGENIKSVTYSSENMYFSVITTGIGYTDEDGNYCDYYIKYSDIKPLTNTSYNVKDLEFSVGNSDNGELNDGFTCSYEDAKRMIFPATELEKTFAFMTETDSRDEKTRQYVKNHIDKRNNSCDSNACCYSTYYLEGFSKATSEEQYIIEQALKDKSVDITVTFDDGTQRTKRIVFGTESRDVYIDITGEIQTRNVITARLVEE